MDPCFLIPSFLLTLPFRLLRTLLTDSLSIPSHSNHSDHPNPNPDHWYNKLQGENHPISPPPLKTREDPNHPINVSNNPSLYMHSFIDPNGSNSYHNSNGLNGSNSLNHSVFSHEDPTSSFNLGPKSPNHSNHSVHSPLAAAVEASRPMVTLQDLDGDSFGGGSFNPENYAEWDTYDDA